MSKDYEILSYCNVKDEIQLNDIVKISIFMRKCRNIKYNMIEFEVTEHIFCIVKRIEGDNIFVSVNNHMFYEPYDYPTDFRINNIICIKKNQIKELKRYTKDNLHKTLTKLNEIFISLPLDKQLYLLNSNKMDREIFIEQLLNSNL